MENTANAVGRRTHLSKAQKLQILKEHQEQRTPISQLARRHGIHALTIYNWKRTMTHEDDSITPETIRQLLSEISNLKSENKQLKVKVADLAISNEILTDAIEIGKKRELLKQAQLLEKSKGQKNSK